MTSLDAELEAYDNYEIDDIGWIPSNRNMPNLLRWGQIGAGKNF